MYSPPTYKAEPIPLDVSYGSEYDLSMALTIHTTTKTANNFPTSTHRPQAYYYTDSSLFLSSANVTNKMDNSHIKDEFTAACTLACLRDIATSRRRMDSAAGLVYSFDISKDPYTARAATPMAGSPNNVSSKLDSMFEYQPITRMGQLPIDLLLYSRTFETTGIPQSITQLSPTLSATSQRDTARMIQAVKRPRTVNAEDDAIELFSDQQDTSNADISNKKRKSLVISASPTFSATDSIADSIETSQSSEYILSSTSTSSHGSGFYHEHLAAPFQKPCTTSSAANSQQLALYRNTSTRITFPNRHEHQYHGISSHRESVSREFIEPKVTLKGSVFNIPSGIEKPSADTSTSAPVDITTGAAMVMMTRTSTDVTIGTISDILTDTMTDTIAATTTTTTTDTTASSQEWNPATVPQFTYQPSGRPGIIYRSVKRSAPVETLINPHLAENIPMMILTGHHRQPRRVSKKTAKQIGRPFTDDLSCHIIFASSLQEILNHGQHPSSPFRSVRVSFVNWFNKNLTACHTGFVANDKIHEYIKHVFKVQDYHFVQLVRLGKTDAINHKVTADRKQLQIVKFVEIPMLQDTSELTVSYLKQIIAYPRYKAEMRFYILPGYIPCQRWTYMSMTLLEQENLQILSGRIPITEPVEIYVADAVWLKMARYEQGNSLLSMSSPSSSSSSSSRVSRSTNTPLKTIKRFEETIDDYINRHTRDKTTIQYLLN